MKYVRHARCVRCGAVYEAVPALTTCRCGGMLDIEYDYEAIRADFSPADLEGCRDYSMWRYRPFLPVEEQAMVSAPASLALTTAMAEARSFREEVGFWPSSLR